MSELATIIPPSIKCGPTPAHGTRVVLADGSQLRGVTRIEMVAELNGIWRARIDCLVNVEPMAGVVVEINQGTSLAWWRKALLRMAGAQSVEVTSMGSSEREYRSLRRKAKHD